MKKESHLFLHIAFRRDEEDRVTLIVAEALERFAELNREGHMRTATGEVGGLPPAKSPVNIKWQFEEFDL